MTSDLKPQGRVSRGRMLRVECRDVGCLGVKHCEAHEICAKRELAIKRASLYPSKNGKLEASLGLAVIINKLGHIEEKPVFVRQEEFVVVPFPSFFNMFFLSALLSEILH
ncbi:hypothetical protein BUALT_Bualt06G0054300 [Buddleja alternifolia]|uniref:Uncharacterized protein n=1 Tax=Buddleja alternifolia TaxID=168488 RepID=A0AAV6XCJ2_9LAMI|nr:hypothetical protein BUALT_Bualt06G0054300 [Buddleja alternifolia]